jgi:hypothetical protein
MKKSPCEPVANDDMQPEYDFSGKKGVRGKYHQAYRQRHTVKIHEADGTVSVQYFTLEEGAVMLEPDVREYFPDSRAVNKALRSLIELIPDKPDRRKTVAKSSRGRDKSIQA